MAPKKLPPKINAVKLNRPSPPKPSTPVAQPAKSFKIEEWSGSGDGEKVVGYADTGMGKTTLFSMMPNAVFIGLDDGGRRIVNPLTGEALRHVPDVGTYEDLRAVLSQPALFPPGSSCVIDTFTLAELLAEAHVLATVRTPTGGQAKNIKSYGFNEGSSHLLDAMRVILQDLDGLIRRGVNVGLACQEHNVKVANAEGADYLQTGPKLHHDNQYSIMLATCEWADHVFRIGYLDTRVVAAEGRAIGKAISGDSGRAIYTRGAPHFRAKMRLLRGMTTEESNEINCVSFDNPADDSLWRLIFGQEGV